MDRIGMFGGTFDPPHLAHMIAAVRAVEAFELDKLIFVPANIPPHKTELQISSASHRLAMLRLAMEGNQLFEVSDVEIKRATPSYTIDTLDIVKSKLDVNSLFLFIGLDQLAIFGSWKEYKRILNENTVVVMNRPPFDILKSDPMIREKVKFLTIPQLEVSSTDIRARVRKGRSIQYLIPEAVRRYVLENNLYQSTLHS